MDHSLEHPERTGGLRRAAEVIVLLVVAALAVLLLIFSAQIFLLLFAGALLGLLLDGAARLLARWTPAPRWLCLTLVLLVITGALAGASVLFGSRLSSQAAQLTDRIPGALGDLQARLQATELGQAFGLSGRDMEELMPSASALRGRIQTVVTSTLGAVGSVLLVAFLGIYLAVTPEHYLEAVAYLFPPPRRSRVREVAGTLGHVLRRWLVGRLLSMAVVGLLTGIGLWALNVPLAFALGVVAALCSIVPYIGPIVSFVPAGLVAFSQGSMFVVYVGALYLGVQLVESYVITPLIAVRAVHLPPAFTISVQVLLGYLMGILGILLATPLAVVTVVLVQIFYVRDVLHEDVRVLGDHG